MKYVADYQFQVYATFQSKCNKKKFPRCVCFENFRCIKIRGALLYWQSASIVFRDKMYYNNCDNFAVQGDIILMELKENDIEGVKHDQNNKSNRKR